MLPFPEDAQEYDLFGWLAYKLDVEKAKLMGDDNLKHLGKLYVITSSAR